MRILYDYQGFHQRIGGISRYYCESIKRLMNYPDVNIKIAAPFTDNVYLGSILGIGNSPLWGKLPSKLRKDMSEIYCKRKISKKDFDILHATFDTDDYFEDYLSRPYVLTFHDLIPEFFMTNDPEWRYLFPKREKILRNASRIICICKYTKEDLLNYYPFIDPDKIDVVYHGITPYNEKYKCNNNGKYILFVGGRREYKNFRFSVKALKSLLEKNDDLKLICTGFPFSKEEVDFISCLKLKNKVINVGYLDEETLANLYHHAQVFIFPSKYEGFGLPILEAFIHGCPACIANASCFPEIASDAVSYFDPNNEESILNSVTRVLEDKKYADFLRHKGQERSKLFTWENTAEGMYKCYKKVLSDL